MTLKIQKRYILFIFFFIVTPSQSQLITEINDYVDSQIGIQNSYLFNGKTYSNNYRVRTNKSQFLIENSNYSIGKITTQEITFKDLELQYDLFSQELIIKPDSKTSLYSIVIDSTKLERFEIDNMVFYNLRNLEVPNGYYELALDKPNFKLYIKHKKTKRRLLDKKTVYYEFNPKYEYFLYNNQNFISINSKKECLAVLPNYKKEIKDFFSKNNSIKNTNEKEFMKKLVIYFNTLKNTTNEK